VGGGDDILFTESAGGKIFERLCRSGAASNGMFTPVSGMIRLSTGLYETSWPGSQAGLPETRRQAIVLRNDDSQNRGMAMDSKLPNAAVVGLLHEVVC